MFCREPRAGHVKTRLIPKLGARAAAQLAGAFIADALAKCRALSPVPEKIVIAGSASGGARMSRYLRLVADKYSAELIDQGGGSLGARMARSLEPYRAAGAVLLGTDTPSLPIELLARSVALLRRSTVVLAPSLDGGYYLVGVRGPMPDIFRSIAWGRPSVLRKTLAKLRRAGVRYALGPAWYDVDRWTDVMLLAAHLERAHPMRLSKRRVNTRRSDVPCPATAKVLGRLGLLPAGR